jgi:predicted amidohydrolase YtcJ
VVAAGSLALLLTLPLATQAKPIPPTGVAPARAGKSGLLAQAGEAGSTTRAADLVLRGAQIITMDPAQPMANVLAIRDGEIVYVGHIASPPAAATEGGTGADAEASQPSDLPAGLLGPRTRVLQLDGNQTVLPGLIDAHAHLVGLGRSLEQIDLRGARGVAEVAERVAGRVAREAEGGERGFLVGRGWDQNLFTPPQLPDVAARRALDAASGGRPLLLRRIDGHAVWVNSELLRRAGISRGTADPAGGRILRGADGEPTGVLVDNAMSLVERYLPPPSRKEIEAAILSGAEHVAARGLTAIHEMGASPEEISVYRQLSEEGRLPLRVYAYHEDPMPAALARYPHSSAYQAELLRLGARLGPPETVGRFALRGIKLYMDGALGSRGAALFAPYSDEPNHKGLLLIPPEHVQEMARWAVLYGRGHQIATHAIGDRANHLVLSAYEAAGVRADRDLRFRIEHAQVLFRNDLEKRRFQKLGVIASIQPSHAVSDMPWAEKRLGPERVLLSYAYRSLLLSGARIAAGSDFPVEEADPRIGLSAAILRTDEKGMPSGGFLPQERLTLGEALRAFTTDAAYAAFAEDSIGQIRIGHRADLTVFSGRLDGYLLGGPAPSDLRSRSVLLTMIDGQVVFERLGLSTLPPGGTGSGKNTASRPRRRG